MSVRLLCCQGGVSSVFVTCQCCYYVVRVISAVFLSHVSAVIVLSGWSHVSAVIVSVVILQRVSAVIVSVVSFHHVSAVIVSVVILQHVSAVIVLSGWCQ